MDKIREKKLALSFLNSVSTEDKIRILQTDISWESLEVFLGKKGMELFVTQLEWENNSTMGIEHGHIFYDEDDYPSSLKNDPEAPYRLSYIGAKPKGTNGNYNRAESLTVVGTRRCTSEGIGSAFMFTSDASSAGLVIYSGFADGIDKAAHYGAISQKSASFAILASGFAHEAAYKQEKLQESILLYGGGLISPFPCEEEPFKWNYYYRNRIMSSISDATVVVEAPEHSGALITAHYAAECGKDVFVLSPHINYSKTFLGNIKLIKEGGIEIKSYGTLCESYLQFPKGHITIPIKREKIPYMKTSEDAKRIVAYNGTYYAVI